MNTFVKLYQDVFFRTLDRCRHRQNIQRLQFLRRSQFWNREELEEWQLDGLNYLLKAAKENSPFYAEQLREVELPLKHLSEIQILPVLNKQDIQNHRESIRCSHIPASRIELCNTGGSTGEPTVFYHHKVCLDWAEATRCRGAEWANVYLGEKTVHMTGSPFDHDRFETLKWKVIFWLRRYKHMSVAYVNDTLLDDYFHQIVRYKPTSIWGFSSGIYLFALFIERNYPDSEFDFLKAVITWSESLQPEQRKKINAVFGRNKVFDHYGSREVYIASECNAHHGYHIHAEVILLEVVDQNGMHVQNGDMGRILVTDLSNQAFPFIRYEIGDVGVMSDCLECPCGVTLPLLDRIEGRITDIIILRDRKLTPTNFTWIMRELSGIDAFQIMQNTVDQLIVKIVRNDEYNGDIEQKMRAGLEELAGRTAEVTFQYVDDIPVSGSGKRRFVISNVSSDFL